MREKKKHPQKETEETNKKINEEFYGDGPSDPKGSTSESNEANEKLNEKFYEDDQQSDADTPMYGSNNIPTVKVNKNKKK